MEDQTPIEKVDATTEEGAVTEEEVVEEGEYSDGDW